MTFITENIRVPPQFSLKMIPCIVLQPDTMVIQKFKTDPFLQIKLKDLHVWFVYNSRCYLPLSLS